MLATSIREVCNDGRTLPAEGLATNSWHPNQVLVDNVCMYS